MRELLRFVTVGSLNTLIGLSCIYVAMGVLGLGFVASNALGYTVGIMISFALNRSWTFGHDGSWRHSLPKWLVVVGVAYACNLLVATTVRDRLGVDPYWAQLCGVVVYTAVSFAGARWFAFASPAGKSSNA